MKPGFLPVRFRPPIAGAVGRWPEGEGSGLHRFRGPERGRLPRLLLREGAGGIAPVGLDLVARASSG